MGRVGGTVDGPNINKKNTNRRCVSKKIRKKNRWGKGDNVAFEGVINDDARVARRKERKKEKMSSD